MRNSVIKTSEKIKDLRENRFTDKLTLKQVAELLKISQRQTYERYERYEEEKIPFDLIGKMCYLYKVSANYFMDECFGETRCILSVSDGFKPSVNKQRKVWKPIYRDLKYGLSFLTFDNRYKATEFFGFEIPEGAFENYYHESKDDHHKMNIFDSFEYMLSILNVSFSKQNEIVSLSKDADLRNSRKYKNTMFVMQKKDHEEIVKNNIDIFSICVIAPKNKNITYLAFVAKTKEYCYIIPFYDVTNKKIIPDYILRTLYKNGMICFPNEEFNNSSMTIDDIEIIAETLFYYDPCFNFNVRLNDYSYEDSFYSNEVEDEDQDTYEYKETESVFDNIEQSYNEEDAPF